MILWKIYLKTIINQSLIFFCFCFFRSIILLVWIIFILTLFICLLLFFCSAKSLWYNVSNYYKSLIYWIIKKFNFFDILFAERCQYLIVHNRCSHSKRILQPNKYKEFNQKIVWNNIQQPAHIVINKSKKTESHPICKPLFIIIDCVICS